MVETMTTPSDVLERLRVAIQAAPNRHLLQCSLDAIRELQEENERLRKVLLRIECASSQKLRSEAERLGLGSPTIDALKVGYRSTHREASAYRGALVTIYKALVTQALTQEETP